MNGVWEDEEVKNLFATVENAKANNSSLKIAFEKHGVLYARKANSVRNYYYSEVDKLKKDHQRCERLGIDLNKHIKNDIVYFSKEEELSLMEQIESMTKNGLSIRKACLEIAKGDVDLLLRYQNKYRNYISKKKNKTVSENIIEFKKPQKSLSDNEVQSLFMGLVRLVKKNAVLEGEEKYKQQLASANLKLRRALVDIQTQALQIEKLKEKYKNLKHENSALIDKIMANHMDKNKQLKIKFRSKEGEIGRIEELRE